MRKPTIVDAPTTGAAAVNVESGIRSGRRSFGAGPFRVAFVTLVAGVLALTVTQGTALAGDNLADCLSGQVCLYEGSLADNDMVDSSYGTLSHYGLKANTSYYVVNNGNAKRGLDHYYFEHAGKTKCLHFNVGTTLNQGSWVYLRSSLYQILSDQRWGGECP
ncbi:hypothetical protein [Streptosporangium sp. NPDC020145]|uniref:Peptidase inhibitor family I36 n=1 Tax=Streptosporangium jomthongense TaxID=1193683 RepID=A0ABV8EU27_9ACTN